MLLGYQRKPPFGRWLAAASANGLFFPSWLFNAANEFIAHLHAALAVMHDPTTGEHRQIDSLYAMASLEINHEVGYPYYYSYRKNQGFVDTGLIQESSAGYVQLTLAEAVAPGNIEWFGNQVHYYIDEFDSYAYPIIRPEQTSDVNLNVAVRFPLATAESWQPARTNFWVAGVRTRPVED